DWSAVRRTADIVDQDVDPTKAIETTFHHGLDRCGVGHVAPLRHDLAARCFRAFDGFSDTVEIAINRKNLRAFFGKTYGGSASIAPARSDAAGTGYDGDAILQASVHAGAPVNRRAGAKR